MSEAAVLDLTGLKCPLPALKTRKALAGLAAGEELQVICTDPMAIIDIPHLVREQGSTIVGLAREQDLLRFVIRKGSNTAGCARGGQECG